MKVNNLKKIIALIIVVIMAVMIIGITPKVYADGETVAKIGENEYTSLADAVGAVPKDNTQTTITLLKDVVNGKGFIVNAGQNIVIDFAGHKYDASNPTVGSTGTETNACQLLKGSKVTFKNGTFTSTTAKILLQNYCDLTLENMNVYAESNKCQYIASNNFGSLTVRGNTTITSVPGQAAFDLWYGLASNGLYDDGVAVNFGSDFTGKVTGKVEYGAQRRITTKDWMNKVKLTIEGGEFDTTFVASSTTNLDSIDSANIEIKGGTFTSNVENFVANGYTQYTKGDKFVVLPDSNYTVNNKITSLKVGETANLNVVAKNAATQEFIKVSVPEESKDIISLEGQKVTGLKPGEALVNVGLGKKGELLPIYVYNVVAEEQEETTINATSEATNKMVELLRNPTQAVEGIDKTTAVAIVDAIKSGKTIVTEVETEEMKQPTETEKELISKELNEAKVARYYDINIVLKVDGTEIGKITKLANKIELELAVPEGLPAVAKGYTRTFSVVKIHDGKAEVIAKGLTAVDNKIKVSSNEFSTYAVAYIDTGDSTGKIADTKTTNAQKEKTDNPKTGDIGIVIWIALIIISSLGIIVMMKMKKQKTNRK